MNSLCLIIFSLDEFEVYQICNDSNCLKVAEDIEWLLDGMHKHKMQVAKKRYCDPHSCGLWIVIAIAPSGFYNSLKLTSNIDE